MSSFEKMKEKIMRTPTVKDIMPNDLKSFLNHYGFKEKHVKGDHYIYEFPGKTKNFMLNIPMSKPVKPTYIDQIRDKIMEIEGGNYE